MPAKSQAQRGYLYARFGAAWAKKHGFDNKGPLPKYKNHSPADRFRRKKKKGGRS